jgi:hypothetical protein
MLQVAEDVLSTTASNFSSSTIIKLPIHVGVSELEGNGGNNTDGTELLQSVLEYVSSQTFASQVYTQGNFIAADTASSTSGTVPTTLAAAESNSTNQLQDLYFLYYWATDQGYSNMNQRGLQSAAYGTCPGGTCSSCPIGGGASCSACCNEGYEDALVTTVVDDVALSYSPTFFELFNWPNFPITDNTSTLSGATTSMGGTPRS